MTTRTVTAMFSTRADAERAVAALTTELHLTPGAVRISPDGGMSDTGYDQSRPYEETGFFASLKNLFVPDEDRYAYAEGLRRGSVLVSATVDEGHIDHASTILERTGALDLDATEATWRQSGWTGYDATAHQGMATTNRATDTAVAAGADDTIKVVEERLTVGKREVSRGSVRVRSYVVETPVEESVTLHQESVRVDRHPVDRAATAADIAAFGERVIEARGTAEEAVVAKTVHVVEEIGVRKEASDRTETVHDSVRSTKVDVEDTTNTTAAGVTKAGMAGTTDTNPPGTMASRAVDKTLGTNISGTNPKI